MEVGPHCCFSVPVSEDLLLLTILTSPYVTSNILLRSSSSACQTNTSSCNLLVCKHSACSLNARHRLVQFKVLHIHYSKVKLHNIFPDISPLCDISQSTEADLLHSFDMCAKLHGLCVDIFSYSQEYLKYRYK